jgi:catabolite regulation protein CreA
LQGAGQLEPFYVSARRLRFALNDFFNPFVYAITVGRKLTMKKLPVILLSLALVACVRADEIGEVSTAFILIGANHKVVVEAYDDPKVNGVTCYVSRAKTCGVKGAIGLAEDKSEASIACRQVGPISF